MIISLGEVNNELELERKLELLCDKIDHFNLVVYQIGDMYLVCNTEPSKFTTN